MAKAIIRGATARNILEPEQLAVVDPDDTKHLVFKEMGVKTFIDAEQGIQWLAEGEGGGEGVEGGAGQIMLAVKPQVFPKVAAQFKSRGGVGERVVISIMAGVQSRVICDQLGGDVRVIRVMPNTPASIGQGATAIALGAGATDADAEFAQRIFEAAGPVVQRLDESMIDAFTAVAGSGPAYVFYLAEAMVRGAVEVGFEEEVADRIVRQTIAGAAGLMSATLDRSARELRDAVTSKRGTTDAATSVLDEKNLHDAVRLAIKAARNRGQAMAGE